MSIAVQPHPARSTHPPGWQRGKHQMVPLSLQPGLAFSSSDSLRVAIQRTNTYAPLSSSHIFDAFMFHGSRRYIRCCNLKNAFGGEGRNRCDGMNPRTRDSIAKARRAKSMGAAPSQTTSVFKALPLGTTASNGMLLAGPDERFFLSLSLSETPSTHAAWHRTYGIEHSPIAIG